MNVFSYRIKGIHPLPVKEIFKHSADPELISFSAGMPAEEALPSDIISGIVTEILRDEPLNALNYTSAEGYLPLREYLKTSLAKDGSFNPREDEIIITNGAQQAIEIITKIICNEGETIICEEPSYIGALAAFRSYSAKLCGVPMDEDGIRIELLELALKENPRTAFIYLIPDFQNPTGICMSLERRKQVLELAYKYNVMILEDSPYTNLRFTGVDIPSLKQLDTKGNVMYIGSFSKILAPGLRVGYLVAPQNIAEKAVACVQASTFNTSALNQMIVYRFITSLDMEEHIDSLRSIYKEKCDFMINSLGFTMPRSVSFTQPEGGFYIWCTVPDGDVNYLAKKALENKVAIVSGTQFMPDVKKPCYSFRLNFSKPSCDEIEKGINILAKVAGTMYR